MVSIFMQRLSEHIGQKELISSAMGKHEWIRKYYYVFKDIVSTILIPQKYKLNSMVILESSLKFACGVFELFKKYIKDMKRSILPIIDAVSEIVRAILSDAVHCLLRLIFVDEHLHCNICIFFEQIIIEWFKVTSIRIYHNLSKLDINVQSLMQDIWCCFTEINYLSTMDQDIFATACSLIQNINKYGDKYSAIYAATYTS